MNKNLNIIAKELFGKIRSQFPKIKLGDADSAVTDKPEDARFFNFEYTQDGKMLGNVDISLSEDDGLVVIYSNDIVKEQGDASKKQFFNFQNEFFYGLFLFCNQKENEAFAYYMIDVEFIILKRKVEIREDIPTHRISRHIPANGKPSVNKAWNGFKEFVDTIFDSEGNYRIEIDYPKKPSKLCEWCEFFGKHCDGKN
jgi:hypothetical protein